MSYNFDKNTCDRCGVSKEQAKGIYEELSNGERRYTKSFSLGNNGEVHCAPCHKEKELESLFNLMDRKFGEMKSAL